MKAGEFVYAWLKQRAAVTAIIGSGDNIRAHPVSIPQGWDYPAVSYQVITGRRLGTFTGGSDEGSYLVQVNCYGRGRGQLASVNTLADAIKGTEASPGLFGYQGTLGGITVAASILEDERETYEPFADGSDDGFHGIQLDFRLWLETA